LGSLIHTKFRYDEWVDEENTLEHTEENLKIQKEMMANAKKMLQNSHKSKPHHNSTTQKTKNQNRICFF
jgi:hypothetical protein